MICIITCAIIYYCAGIQQLTPLFAGISLAIGVVMHILRNLSLKFPGGPHCRYCDAGFKVLLLVFPLSALGLLILFLPTEHRLYTTLQCLGFICIGLFLVSIYENRTRRSESF
ncbi:hypothetical protein [Acinetobacter sp. WZC-1]|uniref:hypothetical protein n=1 Tax=Acinetobacter sp. WZC-1 TaxID=3459034 RepID=UPI00403DACB1